MELLELAEEAQRPSPWRVGNEVLYKLCHANPHHRNEAEVIAKIWLIGRSYAAAIERRKNKTNLNDDFYVSTVAPQIVASGIDDWIADAQKLDTSGKIDWPRVLHAHHKTTQLFFEISGLEKRSLASKYLHFHAPDIFYIYDTRAVDALSAFGHIVGRASRTKGAGDNEYRKFVEKCRSLKQFVQREHGISLTPRELDNLLLSVHAQRPNNSFKPIPLRGSA